MRARYRHRRTRIDHIATRYRQIGRQRRAALADILQATADRLDLDEDVFAVFFRNHCALQFFCDPDPHVGFDAHVGAWG